MWCSGEKAEDVPVVMLVWWKWVEDFEKVLVRVQMGVLWLTEMGWMGREVNYDMLKYSLKK